MREAYLVDTPLQLFNTIRLLLAEKNDRERDLYIVNQFRNAGSLAEKVRASGLFTNVYVLPKEKMGALKHLWIIIGLINPNFYSKAIIGHDFRRHSYDVIYFSYPTKLLDFIIASIRAENIYAIEDGLGSYFGDIFHDFLRKRYVFARKITGNEYSIKALYLNSPQMYVGNTDIAIKEIKTPEIKGDVLAVLESIFGNETEIKKYPKIIYLNQPLKDIDPHNKECSILKILEPYKNKTIVRIHPRETKTKVYESFPADYSSNMWELICPSVVTNESIIIGAFSTAQFTPKVMYGIEPTLIFSYQLYSSFGSEQIDNIEKLIAVLKNGYSDKNKIITVKNEEDLKSALETIRDNEKGCQ